MITILNYIFVFSKINLIQKWSKPKGSNLMTYLTSYQTKTSMVESTGTPKHSFEW